MNKLSFYQKVFRTFGILAMALGLACCTTGCLEYMVYNAAVKPAFTPGGSVNEQKMLEKAFASNDDEKMETAANQYLSVLPRKSATDLLDRFCEFGNSKVALLLLNHHVEPSRSALYFAAKSGSMDICKRLLEAGCDINEVDQKTGCSGLFGAIESGNTNLYDFFKEKRANVNITDIFGSNPLMYAAQGNQYALRSLIDDSNIDLNSQDQLGNTALIYSALMNNTNCLNWLLTHNAKPDVANTNNQTALQLALDGYNFESAFILTLRSPKDIPSNDAYLTGTETLIRAELANDLAGKATALRLISNANSTFSKQLKLCPKTIADIKAVSIGNMADYTDASIKKVMISTQSEMIIPASPKASTKVSRPAICYKLYARYNLEPELVKMEYNLFKEKLLGVNNRDWDAAVVKLPGDEMFAEKYLVALTYKKVFLQRRIAICSLILQRSSIFISREELSSILKTPVQF